MLDPNKFSEYLTPQSGALEYLSSSPFKYHLQDSPFPGYPANPRMQLPRLYMQLGNYLDYYTGQHNPSLSASVRLKLDPLGTERDRAELAELHRPIFPQLAIVDQFPPCFLLHGTVDTAVKIAESRNMHRLLKSQGRISVLHEVEDEEHSFDYAPGSDMKHAELFSTVVQFLREHLT